MQAVAAALSALAIVSSAPLVSAQIIPPIHVGGPAQKAMDQLHPPTPLQQATEQSLKQSPPLPPAAPAAERWVPERVMFVPELGRTLRIPGHYERRITDQQYEVPTIPAYDVKSGATVILPGGNRLPYDLRQGP